MESEKDFVTIPRSEYEKLLRDSGGSPVESSMNSENIPALTKEEIKKIREQLLSSTPSSGSQSEVEASPSPDMDLKGGDMSSSSPKPQSKPKTRKDVTSDDAVRNIMGDFHSGDEDSEEEY